jgi:hypothetical protein
MRHTVKIKDYRLVKQYKMKGNCSPEEAAKTANEWTDDGYEVDVSQEEKKGDEALSIELTYLVEATRTVVELDDTAINMAQAVLQENLNIRKAKVRKKK